MFKLKVKPNTLTDPPGSFNLRDQKNSTKKKTLKIKTKHPLPLVGHNFFGK